MAGPLDTFKLNVGIGERLSDANTNGSFNRPRWRSRQEPQRRDPARGLDNAPPNFSLPVLPHVVTFQGISASVSKAYRSPDEAIKHSLDNARFMRNDASVMECIESRQRGTALLDWQLEVDGPELPYHKALVDRLTGILKRTPFFLKYRENLLHALWYGRYAVQNMFGWHVANGKRDIVIREWLPINGDKLVFRMDDGRAEHPPDQVGVRVGPWCTAGDLVQGRRVEATELGLATFLSPDERQWLAIHKHMIEDAAYESPIDAGSIHGIGIRSRIYWTWFQKQETLAMLMEYLERSALGFEIWTYPEGNPAAKAQTEEAARNRIGRKNIILFPKPIGDDNNAYGVEHYEPSAAGAEALKAIITDYFGHQMKRYILGQTLSSEADATGLGSGVADLHYQTFLDIIKYDATNLEETITREVVGPLKKYNDPRAASVDVRFVINTQSPDTESKLAAYEKAWDMGARLKATDVLDLIGASMPTESDEVLQNPAAGQQAGGMPGMPGQPGAAGGNGTSVSFAGAMTPLGKSMQDKIDQHGTMEDQMGAALQGGNGQAAAKYANLCESVEAAALETDTDPSEARFRIDEKKLVDRFRKAMSVARYKKNFKESEHPRDDSGEFATKEGGGKLEKRTAPTSGKASGKRTQEHAKNERIERALAAHKLTDKEVQRYSEEHNEPLLAKAIGGKSYADNEPVDVAIPSPKGIKHGVELKTIVDNSNAKITIKTYPLARKMLWERTHKVPFHTVVFDDTEVYKAAGEDHDPSNRKIYYRRGYGSFRIGAMHECKNVTELRQLIDMPDEKLPKKAARVEKLQGATAQFAAMTDKQLAAEVERLRIIEVQKAAAKSARQESRRA